MTRAQADDPPDPVRGARRRRGDYPTPVELVDRLVGATLPPVLPGQRVSILDPACGDGRLLTAAAERVRAAGGIAEVHGVDVDARAVERARENLAGVLAARVDHADALNADWGDSAYDVVVGNPPFLSQLAASTTRGKASVHGGGPYADAAAEFLALAVRLARPGGGRVGLILPQSILGSRDAGTVRAGVASEADLTWSWWSPRPQFDAAVIVCALVFERREATDGNCPPGGGDQPPVWSAVVTRAVGVPDLTAVDSSATLGTQAEISANFRDEYYGLVPAVGDHDDGPRLITSGLIDPNRCRWGDRPVTFNRRRFWRPRVDVSRLDERMSRWARSLAVPKVLVANQTRVIECIVDRSGELLPSVPVVTARSRQRGAGVDEIAAVLSSPYASAWLWHAAAGTGLSARTVRLRPALLAELPWPAGSLVGAVEALHRGDLAATAAQVHDAYGLDAEPAARLTDWWERWRPPGAGREGRAA